MRASERITVRLHACALAKAHISTLTGGGGHGRAAAPMDKNPTGSAGNFFRQDDFEVQQEGLWRWAAERVPSWGKVQRDDYDFRWIGGALEGLREADCIYEHAREKLLSAGCLYEYARESHKFRCLLVLNNKKREERSGGLMFIKYEENSDGNVHLIRSGWDRWLGDFAEELIANKSFAELLRTSGSKVWKSLDALAGYNLYPKAIELPGRHINVPGMQEVVIQIDWRHYDNKEIGAEMARWAANNRPESEPEPDRTGKKRESKVRSDLKALSAMRIWKHERDRWKRLRLVAEVCGYKGCRKESAEHKESSRREHGGEPMSNIAKAEMTRARKRALSLFQLLFPWGKPTNY
jgi:hypothetical protein